MVKIAAMEAQEHTKTRGKEPLPLSQIILSTNNPFVSSAKVKIGSEQSKKRPAEPTSKYEFVQLVPDKPMKTQSHKKIKKVAELGSNSSTTSYAHAMEKPTEDEASLFREYPSFIKKMRRSHLSPCFLLRIPRGFSKLHLPNCGEVLVILEDENGKQYETKCLVRCSSLSQGWNHFAKSNNLQEGDLLYFHLVEPCKFKVSIQREKDFGRVDGNPTMLEPREIDLKKEKQNITQDNVEANNFTVKNHNLPTTISHFRKCKIIVGSDKIDSKIPKHTRIDYINLCHARKMLLHRHLIKGIGSDLAASIINETTKIANAIRSSNISTPREDIAYWNTALQSFEFFGMDVGFMRSRLDRLLDITRDCSKAIMEFKKNENIEVALEGMRIEEEIREHEKKIQELEILKRRVEMRSEESRNEIVEKCKLMYKEEAKAPW